ncbi:MAG: hypothetical protein JHC74_00140 [Thermoleophilia bacterium]|nr:hypothetical protein [Thermoleophilia bacterium]
MPCARRLAPALVAALVIAVLAAGSALAADATPVTQRIFADYSLDRVINGDYTASDLQAALDEAQKQGAPFEEFEAAVQDVYDRDFLGLDTGDGDGLTPQPPDPDESTLLPEPRGPGERDQPPWPFLAMSALAAALVLSGAGSSIYRRVHR